MYALTRTPWPFCGSESADYLPIGRERREASCATYRWRFEPPGGRKGLTLMFDIATSVPEQRGWSTYVFYQRKQVRCSDANTVVAKTGMITAAIDVAVRGQAIEAVCHCSGWRRRGQDVPSSLLGCLDGSRG